MTGGKAGTEEELWAMIPNRKMPLFIVSGASGVGKSSACELPEQFEVCDARALFTEIHYIAVVCGGEELERRMRKGRGITDESWLESSRHFNGWLKRHARETVPAMELLDNTRLSVEETAERIAAWILERLGE